jgi:hypothetical protein
MSEVFFQFLLLNMIVFHLNNSVVYPIHLVQASISPHKKFSKIGQSNCVFRHDIVLKKYPAVSAGKSKELINVQKIKREILLLD